MSFQDWTVEAIEPKIDGFVGPLLRAAQLDLNYAVGSGEKLQNRNLFSPDLIVNFKGSDTDLLLAQRGQLLLAIEQLTLEALRVPHRERYRLVFDCQDYRESRFLSLRAATKTKEKEEKQLVYPALFR